MNSLEFSRRYARLILLSWTIPPIFGLSFLLFIKMFTPTQMWEILSHPLEPLFILTTLLGAVAYFHYRVRPVRKYLERPSAPTAEHALAYTRLFPLEYWGVFIFYLLMAPSSVIISAQWYSDFVALPVDWFRIHLVALIVSIIVGLPIFYRILDLFGDAYSKIHLQSVQVSLKAKIFLLGALIPLLIDTMLVQYFWTRTGYFTLETFGIWLLLELLAIAGTMTFVTSFSRSLAPLQTILERSPTLSSMDTASLIVRSTDEIGVLTCGYRGLLNDMRIQSEIIHTSNRILSGIGKHITFAEIASSILRTCDEAIPGGMSFLLLHKPEDKTLIGVAHTGVEYNPHGHYQLALTENALSVRAFNSRKTIAIDDAMHDPRVNKSIIHRFDVATALATPLIVDGQSIGVLITSYKEGGHIYSVRDIDIIEGLAHEAALALHTQMMYEHHQVMEAEMRIATSVFRDTQEAIMVTDAEAKILRVNQAFTMITGYSQDEVIGKRPSILSSGRHDQAFYQHLWNKLLEDGVWEGEVWNRRKDGLVYPEWLNISASLDETGKAVHYIGIFTDITEKKRTEEEIFRLAHYDEVTELPNRVLFNDHLGQSLKQASRHGHQVAVLFVDLDHFKQINDTMGHAAGDKLLLQVANRIKECVRKEDTVARQGGDEFILILNEVKGAEGAAAVAGTLIQRLRQPFELEGSEVFISSSIGISIYPNDATDEESLLKNADAAMYRAKENGRSNYQFFTREMNESAMARFRLEARLRRALERNEFIPYYQPQVNIQDGTLAGVEVLLRWKNDENGEVAPDDFIKIAEDSGEIIPITRWLIDVACRDFQSWLNADIKPGQIAFNLTSRHLRQTDFADEVAGVMQKYGLRPHQIEFEITEGMLIEGAAMDVKLCADLKQLGTGLALDDFGTGYSSLSYLKRFPIDTVKIDKSFIRDLGTDADDTAIISAILAMGKSLNLRVIAEGVETEAQLGFLREHGCYYIQGFYYAQPMSHDAFMQWAQTWSSKF